jgi:uncharacterized protein (DUF169 family)/NAD-dependent dihydropyrimidine dehydrogenase PreA subunit
MPEIQLNAAACTGCGLCADFCPVSVFEMGSVDGRALPQVVHLEACWACQTCVGECPANALRVVEVAQEQPALAGGQAGNRQAETFAEPIGQEERLRYLEWARTLQQVLGLRWSPVAISLIPADQPLPDVPHPPTRLRYCQAMMAARRGKTMLMTVQDHACPDGAHVLGLSEIPPKLASGELYVRFEKLDNLEAARRMVNERPHLEGRSMRATLLAPLEKAVLPVDVVAVIAQPEQMMWLCMARSFFSGQRLTFHASGYNAQCAEVTALPYLTGELNLSLGCYGCRASSDVGDDLMFMGIPAAEMTSVVSGLKRLGRKVIGEERRKIYLPPWA